MKLGGSVLTDKRAYRTPRPDVIVRLARELSGIEGPIVVVHGAGSFGHVLAKQHRLKEGDDGDASRRRAFAQVLRDVRVLNGLVVDALLEAGRDAIAVSTFDVARTLDGKPLHFPAHAMRRHLELGLTPVVPGDGVPDPIRRFSILSGDAIMVSLARELRPKRAIFVTDVDGIHDRDPREEGARLLDVVRVGADVGPGDAKGDDVTGGMRGKLDRAADVARAGVEVRVVNGLVEGRLAQALNGETTVGTVVLP